MTSVSVTEVRNALRCPRLFALGRQRGTAVGFPVGSSCLGGAFHRIVDKFARNVASPPAWMTGAGPSAPQDELESLLSRWLLQLLVEELEGDLGLATMPAEVDDLAEALRELAGHLACRLRRFEEPATQALPKLVIAAERAVEAQLEFDGLLVRGRVDALYGDARGATEIIEYKLTDEANAELDRAQVALYRALIRRADLLDAVPVVLRFSPRLRETAMDPAAADDLVERTLRPLLRQMGEWMVDPTQAPPTARRDLCSACPLAQPCIETFPNRFSPRDDPPACATRSRDQGEPAPLTSSDAPSLCSDEEGHKEANEVRDQILTELRRSGIQANCPREPIVGPTLYVIEISRPRGRVSDLDRAAEDVKHRLATNQGIGAEYDKSGGHRHFTVRRPRPHPVLLHDLLQRSRNWLSDRAGRFIVGLRPEGEVFHGDFADAGTPHLLVGGQAGSGKSTFLLSLIASLVQFQSPECIRLTLIDPKRVTFLTPSFHAAVAAHLDGPIGYDVEDAIPSLERLVEVMEERYARFEALSVQSIDDYNASSRARAKLERKVLVIDEFGDLAGDKATAKRFFELVQRLGAKARAAGIHLVLSTQRPDRQVVPSAIKANLGGKVAMKVASGINSRIILDDIGAERLLGKGDLLADMGCGVVRAQAPLMG